MDESAAALTYIVPGCLGTVVIMHAKKELPRALETLYADFLERGSRGNSLK